jgi:hypothetical protein
MLVCGHMEEVQTLRHEGIVGRDSTEGELPRGPSELVSLFDVFRFSYKQTPRGSLSRARTHTHTHTSALHQTLFVDAHQSGTNCQPEG